MAGIGVWLATRRLPPCVSSSPSRRHPPPRSRSAASIVIWRSRPTAKWVGFIDGSTVLKKVAISGGPAVTLALPLPLSIAFFFGGAALTAIWVALEIPVGPGAAASYALSASAR
jgi:hypothetical protein